MLFPATVVVLLVLAALAVDLSIAFLAQRELANASAAAANDAATLALSQEGYYGDGDVRPDRRRVEEVAEARVRGSLDPDRFAGLTVEAEAVPPRAAGCTWTVRVRAAATVPYVFAPALPGGPDRAAVQAHASASPRQDQADC
jgi:Flp pilus assembly protein TadG